MSRDYMQFFSFSAAFRRLILPSRVGAWTGVLLSRIQSLPYFNAGFPRCLPEYFPLNFLNLNVVFPLC